MLPRGLEDCLIDYVFPSAIDLAKGHRLVLLFKGSLFTRLDECVGNATSLVSHYMWSLTQTRASYNYFLGRIGP